MVALTPPTLELNGSPISEQQNPKLLGLTLDPRLLWKPHIQAVTTQTARRLGALHKVTCSHGGVPTPVGINIYKSTVRPLMEYGAALWSGASDTLLAPLISLQRKALTRVTGARYTTSADAIDVDACVVPLTIRWKILSLDWMSKIRRLPPNHPLLIQFNKPEYHRRLPWYNTFCQRVGKTWPEEDSRLKSHFEPLPVLPFDGILKLRLLHPDLMSREDCPCPPKKDCTSESINQAKTWVQNTLKLIRQNADPPAVIAFTDGSCLSPAGPCGSGAAISVEDERIELVNPISTCGSNNVAEFGAFVDVPNWFTHRRLHLEARPLHIFSDSTFAISLLLSNSPLKSGFSHDSIHKLYNLLREVISRGCRLSFHWIPAHIGIPENEKADELAKRAAQEAALSPHIRHNPLVRVPLQLAKLIHRQNAQNEWKRLWALPNTHGRHLYKFNPNITSQPSKWVGSRRFSSLRCQLRHGHWGIQKAHDIEDLCHCNSGDAEDVHHFLFQCSSWSIPRENMIRRAQQNHPTQRVSPKSLLAPTNSYENQVQMHEIVNDFLSATDYV